MKERTDGAITIHCRDARKQFSALVAQSNLIPIEKLSVVQRAAIQRHLQTCARCEREHHLFMLGRTVLDQAASLEEIIPGDEFFTALRAKMARGPETIAPPISTADECWATAMLVIARQLIPAMALLLLLIISATLLWNKSSDAGTRAAVRPSDRVLFSDEYDYPKPTSDDVLETLVAVEEKENGK